MQEEILNQEEEHQEVDVLSMSDEELSNFNPSNYAKAEQEKVEEQPEEPEDKEEEENKPEEEAEAEVQNELEEEEYEEEEETPVEQNVYDGGTSDGVETTEEPLAGVDYKAEYERLLEPFRASKRDIRIKGVDDARRLMQMGVDYTFKMQALKPQLRILRSLEKNGLLQEDKINFLIDLDKNNPEAVKKFLKDKNIDPLSVDLSEDTQYSPKSYIPSNQEIALDEVLDDIRSTPTFERTIDVLGNHWDSESKDQLLKAPQLIKVINDHMGSGVYDQIMTVVESERLLGRLPEMSDLMAYKTVGDALQAQGALKALGADVPKPQRKASQDPALKARKKAASPTKRSPASQPKPSDFNPLALSDEEFEKMAKPAFA